MLNSISSFVIFNFCPKIFLRNGHSIIATFASKFDSFRFVKFSTVFYPYFLCLKKKLARSNCEKQFWLSARQFSATEGEGRTFFNFINGSLLTPLQGF